MPDLRWLIYRLRNLWRRQAREAELDAELQFHIESEAEEQIAAGLPADHARQAARRSLGNITLTKEDARAVWTWGPVERLLQDVRYAIRVLGRQRSFTATAVATIVLIVGGTTAVFTLVNAVLLRPLPYPASGRLVMVRAHDPRGGTGLSYPEVQGLQSQLASFEAWGLYRGPGYGSTLDRNSDNPLPVQDMRITPELFPLLGLKVVLGRPLVSDDAIDANPDVAVIGHDLWRTRFGGTPDVLGKSFELRPGRTVTVVGVAAPGSDVPGNWYSHPIVWHPIRVSEQAAPNTRFTVLARLKAGRPISAANAEIAARPPLTDPTSGANRPVDATLLLDHIVGDSQRVLWVFFGAVTCVLLIGVANLVSLQLVRNAGRERELGVRAALGASRWRLIRQLLVESLLLSIVGGAGGLLAASNVVGLVTSALPANFPRANQIALDNAVWVFAALVSALVGVTIGVVPALRSIQPRLMKRVNEGAWSATLSHRRARIQRGLIAFETAAALVLLVGAGLLVNSFGRLMSEDAGMREGDLWVVRGSLPERYRSPADTGFWLSALRHLRELPDVESAALAVNDGGPLGGGDFSRGGIVPEGQTGGQGRGFSLSHRSVGGGYFSTLGIPIVSGRPILDSDTAGTERVVVLNRAAAAALWPGEDPLGKRLGGGWRLRVVGIVPNFKLTRLDGEVSLQMYTSMQQTTRAGWGVRNHASDQARRASDGGPDEGSPPESREGLAAGGADDGAGAMEVARVRALPHGRASGLCRHGDVPGTDRHLRAGVVHRRAAPSRDRLESGARRDLFTPRVADAPSSVGSHRPWYRGWHGRRSRRQSTAGRVSLRRAGDRSCHLQRRHRPVLLRGIRRRARPGPSKLPRRSGRRPAP